MKVRCNLIHKEHSDSEQSFYESHKVLSFMGFENTTLDVVESGVLSAKTMRPIVQLILKYNIGIVRTQNMIDNARK